MSNSNKMKYEVTCSRCSKVERTRIFNDATGDYDWDYPVGWGFLFDTCYCADCLEVIKKISEQKSKPKSDAKSKCEAECPVCGFEGRTERFYGMSEEEIKNSDENFEKTIKPIINKAMSYFDMEKKIKKLEIEVKEWKHRAIGGQCEVLSVGWEKCQCPICIRERLIEKLKILWENPEAEFPEDDVFNTLEQAALFCKDGYGEMGFAIHNQIMRLLVRAKDTIKEIGEKI